MTLSDALRAAALERAKQNGETIDGVVLEPSGVIDLREMARAAGRETDRRVTLPLLTGRPIEERPDDEHLAETALWRRLRPVIPPPAPAEPIVLDLTRAEPEVELPADGPEASAFDPIVIDLTGGPEPAHVYETNNAPIDATLADEVGRPVEVCDHCGSFGQRDLYDRFSRTEYFSCDDCGHMWQHSLGG